MNEATKVVNEVKASEESLAKQYSYVLHGARVQCEYGSRPSHLMVPTCHGTYVHDMPMMTTQDCKYDCKYPSNIQAFGMCVCENNPDRYQNMDAVLKAVESEGENNLLEKACDVGSAIGGFFSKVKNIFGKKEKEPNKEDKYAEDLKNNIMVLCVPEFAITDTWQGGTDKLMVKSLQALNSGCTITCIKCGGNITVIDDGQENATSEQQGAVDFANWKGSDPMPNATQRNLQALSANIAELEDELETCTYPQRILELQTILNEKNSLKTAMKDTIDISTDLKNKMEQAPYCEDIDGTVNYLEETGELEKMLQNGTLLDNEGIPITTMADAKTLLHNSIEASNSEYEKNSNTLEIVQNSYTAGTPCVKGDTEKAADTINKAAQAATENQTSRNWSEVGNTVIQGSYPTANSGDGIFTAKDNKVVVAEYLDANSDYNMTYDSFNNQPVTSDNASEVAYIYYGNELISQNQYNEMITAEVGNYSSDMDFDWELEG